MITIAIIRKPGRLDSGVGRYTAELARSLKEAGFEIVEVFPFVPIPNGIIRMVNRLFRWDLNAFFINYPIWIRYPEAEIYHLTSQNLATLMLINKPPGRTFLTVHDLINLDFRAGNKCSASKTIANYIFEQLVLIGIRKVDWVIMDSYFSKIVLQAYLSLRPKNAIRKPSSLD